MKKAKLFKLASPLLALALVLALVPVLVATPVAAATATCNLVKEGDGVAAWSDAQSRSGNYSVELYPGGRDWYDWAGVTVAHSEALTAFATIGTGDDAPLDVANTYFYYNIEDGLEGQVPIMAFVFEVGEETWKLILCPELPTWEEGTGEWVKLTAPFTTGHLSKHSGDEYYDFTYLDPGFGWGAPPLYEELGWWQSNTDSPIKDMTVDHVEVSVGTRTTIVYVDDITINSTTYALEPTWYDPDDTTLSGDPTASIEISAPSDISDWVLRPGVTNTETGTLNVKCNTAWQVSASDEDTLITNGYMTEWNGSTSTYGTENLLNPMKVWVEGSEKPEVDLSTGGGAIQEGDQTTDEGDNVTVTFKQAGSYEDDIISPNCYRIVVTFTGVTPGF